MTRMERKGRANFAVPRLGDPKRDRAKNGDCAAINDHPDSQT